MRRLLVLASVSLWMLGACGDDDSDPSSDAGVAGSGGSRAGSGGSRAGSGGRSGAGSGGSGGRSSGGSDGATSHGGSGGSGSDGTQKVTIRFKAKIGSADFACGQSVSGQGTTNATIQPVDFRFYVQDVKLIDDAAKEVAVTLDTKSPWQNKDVALIDFENGTGLCGDGTPETNTEITGTVPRGNYHAIVFSNGVPEALNHGDPATLPDPLRGGTLTWGWLLGYRFIKVEVTSTADVDAEVPGGLFHLGSTGCTNTSLEDGGVDYESAPQIACSKPNRNRVVLDGYDVGQSVIIADAAKIFAQTDLQQVSDCHSGGDACGPMFESVGVNFASGQALTTQTTYSLE